MFRFDEEKQNTNTYVRTVGKEEVTCLNSVVVNRSRCAEERMERQNKSEEKKRYFHQRDGRKREREKTNKRVSEMNTVILKTSSGKKDIDRF